MKLLSLDLVMYFNFKDELQDFVENQKQPVRKTFFLLQWESN